MQNYSSIITVHSEVIDGRPGTMVIESFVVDVPDGNTKDETCYFVEALIKCNLKSLADVSERLAVQDRTELIDRVWCMWGRLLVQWFLSMQVENVRFLVSEADGEFCILEAKSSLLFLDTLCYSLPLFGYVVYSNWQLSSSMVTCFLNATRNSILFVIYLWFNNGVCI